MNNNTPKQFLILREKPVLMHTISQFNQAVPQGKIIVVIAKEHREIWGGLCKKHNFRIKHLIINGGETRFQSVKNALKEVDKTGVVSIHDGVRPLVNKLLIQDCLKLTLSHDCVVPYLPIQDSVRKIDSEKNSIISRETLALIQTPQCFKAHIILKAYQQPYQDYFTDDATVVESLGYKIYLTKGSKTNIKITTPEDMGIAKFYLSK